MEKTALESLVRMELFSFFLFLIFLAGAYWNVEWLQWASALLFIVPVAGILRYPGNCRSSEELFEKARFAWAVITIFLYLGLGWLLVSILG